MPQFIINQNAQANGDHEVHNATNGCTFMPEANNRIDLGIHFSCREAVVLARSKWPTNRINGCYYCCNACHTS